MLENTNLTWRGATVYRDPQVKESLFIVYHRLPGTDKDTGETIVFQPHVYALWSPYGHWQREGWRGQPCGSTNYKVPATNVMRIHDFNEFMRPADLLSA